MFRTMSLTALCLLVSANSAVAQKKPFKSKMAQAAQKTYEEAIAQAKNEYVAKLELAVKAAGSAGDLDEANRLAAEKKRVGGNGNDPLTELRRRLIGTKWYKKKSWNRFDKDNSGISSDGARSFWFVTFKNTVVIQYVKGLTVYAWHFDDKATVATLHSFKKTGNTAQWRRGR